MFMTRKRFDLTVKQMDDQIADLDKRYWSLRRDHAMLLDKLGFEQVTVFEHRKITPKQSSQESEVE
jgi:hypothetical protein